jgi:hypothetical protein
MQAQAAEFPGCAGNSAAFLRGEIKTLCFDSLILNRLLNRGAQPLFKSILARNELVAFGFRVIFAG